MKHKRNQCDGCICYHPENRTCQAKKCATLTPGYVTKRDRLYCEWKNKYGGGADKEEP